MKLYAPGYYENFKCIGGKCPDNCCIGWEIDIDGDTLAGYALLDGEGGEQIRRSISDEGGAPHFRLGKGGRCPHLNEENLCEIILRYGEDMLCEICREHPRYYTLLSDGCEVGVGLACPVAAELILDCRDHTVVEYGEASIDVQEQNSSTQTKEQRQTEYAETLVRAFRESLYRMMPTLTARGIVLFADGVAQRELNDALFDVAAGFIPKEECLHYGYFGSRPIRQRHFNAAAQREAILDILSSLEMLGTKLGNELAEAYERLDGIKEKMRIFIKDGAKQYFESLLFYFTYRYLAGGIEDGSVHLRVRFSIICAFSILLLSYLRGGEREDVLSAATDFSRNVEYSDENLDVFLDGLDSDEDAGVDFIADALG